eukprot:2267587-Rhodomonas_salina.2
MAVGGESVPEIPEGTRRMIAKFVPGGRRERYPDTLCQYRASRSTGRRGAVPQPRSTIVPVSTRRLYHSQVSTVAL